MECLSCTEELYTTTYYYTRTYQTYKTLEIV